jgi:hypothetical protein
VLPYVREPGSSRSTGAVRMRRYRQQRKQGLRPVRILLDEMDIGALIRMEHLKEDERQDPEGALTPPLPGRGGPLVNT